VEVDVKGPKVGGEVDVKVKEPKTKDVEVDIGGKGKGGIGIDINIGGKVKVPKVELGLKTGFLIEILSAVNLAAADKGATSDPYISCYVKGKKESEDSIQNSSY